MSWIPTGKSFPVPGLSIDIRLRIVRAAGFFGLVRLPKRRRTTWVTRSAVYWQRGALRAESIKNSCMSEKGVSIEVQKGGVAVEIVFRNAAVFTLCFDKRQGGEPCGEFYTRRHRYDRLGLWPFIQDTRNQEQKMKPMKTSRQVFAEL